MTITTDQIISKQDVVDYFNTNVVNVAFNGINWHSGSVPTYTSGNNSGVQAVPSTQLSGTSQPTISTSDIPEAVITASTVINVMKNIATNCSRIRYTVCNSYWNTNGTYNLQQQLTGKAVYLVDTPNISGTTTPYYSKTPNVTHMTVDSTASVPATFSSNNTSVASDFTTFISNLVSEWNTRYSTTVTFNYYNCHSQCHSNCYTRARR